MNNSGSLTRQAISLKKWEKQWHKGVYYVLAESTNNPDIPFIAGKDAKDKDSCLYWGQMGKIHASISPYLMPLTDWEAFKESVANQSGWGIIIQLKSNFRYINAPHDYLLNHLREWTLIETSQNEAVLLRLSDWAVLNALFDASTEQQLNSLFGPITRFAYWHKGNTHVESLTLNGDTSSTLLHRSPQKLSQQQYLALESFAHRHQNKKYAEHLKTHHDEVQLWQDQRLNDFLIHNIRIANQHNFTTERDVIRYLSLALVLGENFIQTSWAKSQLNAPNSVGTNTRMDMLFQRGLDEIVKE